MVEPHVREVHIKGQEKELDVDTLATESSVIGEIDTGTATSPTVVLTPSSGKTVDLRSVYLATDSTAGEVWAQFTNSGQLLGKIYCSRFTMVELQEIHVQGAADDTIEIAWSGTDTGAKIFYAIRYKEV